MSERPDPQSQDVTRDPVLDRAYRESARDEPPARLDDAIRAAARREVGARPQPAGGGGLRAWRVPVSIAAMLVVGVSVVTLVREEHPDVLEVSPPAPARDSRMAAPPVPKLEAEADAMRPPAFREAVPGQPAVDAARAKDAAAARVTPEDKLLAVPSAAPPAASASREEPARAEAKRERRDQQDAAASSARNVAEPAPELQRQLPQAFGAPEARPAEAPAPAVQAKPALKSDSALKQESAPPPAMAADSALPSTPRPVAPPPAMKAAPPPPPPMLPAPKPALRSNVAGASAPAAEATAEGRMTQPAAPLAKAQAEGDYAGLDTPDKWLARIREQRKQGRLTEAAKTLAEFRLRYPGYSLPPDLQDGIKP